MTQSLERITADIRGTGRFETYGTIDVYATGTRADRNILKKEISGYEASIAACNAENLGFKKFF